MALLHYLLGANNTHHMLNVFGHKLVMLGNTSDPKPIRISDTYIRKHITGLTFSARLVIDLSYASISQLLP